MFRLDPPATIVLDEQDADRLLKVLYNGTRPKRVHTLICLCGAIADLRDHSSAWDGWQVLPHAKCPACLAETQAAAIEELYPSQAYDRFLQALERTLLKAARGG
jgi:2-keto-3-deoxy-galactonokinase